MDGPYRVARERGVWRESPDVRWRVFAPVEPSKEAHDSIVSAFPVPTREASPPRQAHRPSLATRATATRLTIPPNCPRHWRSLRPAQGPLGRVSPESVTSVVGPQPAMTEARLMAQVASGSAARGSGARARAPRAGWRARGGNAGRGSVADSDSQHRGLGLPIRERVRVRCGIGFGIAIVEGAAAGADRPAGSKSSKRRHGGRAACLLRTRQRRQRTPIRAARRQSALPMWPEARLARSTNCEGPPEDLAKLIGARGRHVHPRRVPAA